MLLEKYKIQELNDANLKAHRQQYEFVAGPISNRDEIIQKLTDFQIAIPSWALGAGGTRLNPGRCHSTIGVAAIIASVIVVGFGNYLKTE